MVEPWPLIESEPVLDAGLFRVTRDRTRSPRTGAERDFHVVHMPDWLMVVPVTSDRRIVMVRQYRHGSRCVGLEVPGGLLEAGEEQPAEGAARELAEETGYSGGELVLLADLMPQPALLSNRARIYSARGVIPVNAPCPDAGEDIEVVLVHPGKLRQMIEEGEVHNAMTVTALALAQLAGHFGPAGL